MIAEHILNRVACERVGEAKRRNAYELVAVVDTDGSTKHVRWFRDWRRLLQYVARQGWRDVPDGSMYGRHWADADGTAYIII